MDPTEWNKQLIHEENNVVHITHKLKRNNNNTKKNINIQSRKLIQKFNRTERSGEFYIEFIDTYIFYPPEKYWNIVTVITIYK